MKVQSYETSQTHICTGYLKAALTYLSTGPKTHKEYKCLDGNTLFRTRVVGYTLGHWMYIQKRRN